MTRLKQSWGQIRSHKSAFWSIFGFVLLAGILTSVVIGLLEDLFNNGVFASIVSGLITTIVDYLLLIGSLRLYNDCILHGRPITFAQVPSRMWDECRENWKKPLGVFLLWNLLIPVLIFVGLFVILVLVIGLWYGGSLLQAIVYDGTDLESILMNFWLFNSFGMIALAGVLGMVAAYFAAFSSLYGYARMIEKLNGTSAQIQTKEIALIALWPVAVFAIWFVIFMIPLLAMGHLLWMSSSVALFMAVLLVIWIFILVVLAFAASIYKVTAEIAMMDDGGSGCASLPDLPGSNDQSGHNGLPSIPTM